MLNLEEVLLPKIQTYLALYCFSQNENDVFAYLKDFFRYNTKLYNISAVKKIKISESKEEGQNLESFPRPKKRLVASQ